MEHTKFSIRIPTALVEALDGEASKKFRNRNQLLTDILIERYNAHAPPIANKIKPSQRSLSKQKTKATA